MGDCCSLSSCCSVNAARCPACGALGQDVQLETVKSMVEQTVPEAEAFGVCLSANCDVVYFSAGHVFRQADVHVPVGWKSGAHPKYVCYCNCVTEEVISRAVIEEGARTIADVVKATGSMKNGNCLVNNPKGTCCHADIEFTVQRALKRR